MDWIKLFTEKNVGKLDRAIRIFFGVILFSLAIFLHVGQIVRTILGLLGVIGIITGIMGHCIIYSLLKLSTLQIES